MMILGLIDITSHDGNNLSDVEGQVLDNSKEVQIITKSKKNFKTLMLLTFFMIGKGNLVNAMIKNVFISFGSPNSFVDQI